MRINSLRRGLVLAATAAMLTVGLPGAKAQAQSVEETYKDQTLTILIGHPPGGSYDLYAQLAAAYMGKFIPGNPNVIVQHMPGGGGRKAAAFFINNTQPDGLTVAILPDTLGQIELLEPDLAAWKSADFKYIGRFASANAAFAVRKDAPATTIEGMRETEIIVGCTGQNARSGQQPAALRAVAGLKFRVICGYKGSKATRLATLRGEVDMVSENWASIASDTTDIDNGDLIIVLQAGLVRDPDLPDVPILSEIVDDPEAKEILDFVSGGAPIGRAMMIHPDTPEEIVTGLRVAFKQMMDDPEFLAEAKKRQAIIGYETGEYVEGVMKKLMATSPELIAAAVTAMDTSDVEKAPE